MTIRQNAARLALAAAFATIAGGAAAAQHTLLPAGPDDLVPTQLLAAKSAPAMATPDIERAPVQFAWALEADHALSAQQPYVAESREYYTEVDASALAKGHALHATAPGAVVRLSPLGQAKALAPAMLTLSRDGEVLPADAMEHAATAEQMKASGVAFADGTLAFRIAPELGGGQYTLKADGVRGNYLLHVYEPQSAWSATLATAADTAFAGGTLAAFMDLRHAKGAVAPEQVRGALSSPDGRVFDVAFTTDARGRTRAAIVLPKGVASTPGLWELHAFAATRAADGSPVLRDVKTSFALVAPTARFGSAVEATRDDAGLAFAFPVKVAAPGRYEVRAVLYGTAPDGTLQPAAAAHSAAWLEQDGSLDLAFGKDVLRSNLRAPWELRELALHDQGRLAKLETRAQALRLEPATPRTAGPER